VFVYLHAHSESTNTQIISDALQLSSSSVNKAIKRLVDADFIARGKLEEPKHIYNIPLEIRELFAGVKSPEELKAKIDELRKEAKP
jgi:predicted transcriptional regulator